MITLHDSGAMTFSIFDTFPELACFVSSKRMGDLGEGETPFKTELEYISRLKLSFNQLILMEQVHGVVLQEVRVTQAMSRVPAVDALVTRERDLFLGVKMADCVPLFFYDPTLHLIATAHAGWKGTTGNIARVVISKMKALGSHPKNILVAIGPHIGSCCYDVDSERAQLFASSFENDSTIAYKSGTKWYIDLGQANRKQLLDEGILKNNIDASIVCTSCQNDRYYSYRKDSPPCGRMLGIIGLRSKT